MRPNWRRFGASRWQTPALHPGKCAANSDRPNASKLGSDTEMHFNHRGIDYTLEDDWWAEAGMASFRPGRRSYRAGPSEFRDLVTFEVAIDDVQPLNRKASHGVFNDSEPGRREGSARERVVRILKWFRDDAPVEPGAWRGCQRGLAAGSNWLMARIVSIAQSPPATPTFRPSRSTTSGVRRHERPGTKEQIRSRRRREVDEELARRAWREGR